MKKSLFSILLLLPLFAHAQTEEAVTDLQEVAVVTDDEDLSEEIEQQEVFEFRFGIVSQEAIVMALPEYATVEQEMDKLRADYDAEAKRAANEFNAKYETFLGEQRNYAPSIMRKRQLELEEMMRSNENFRIESHRMMREAREKALAPLRAKVKENINAVATDMHLLFVLNSDGDAVPYILDGIGIDITEAVKERIAQ